MSGLIDRYGLVCGMAQLNLCFKYLSNINRMAQLYNILKPQNTYFDRKYYDSSEDYNAALAVTTTVYIGNLSFFSSQDSVHELFSMAGKVTEIIMGINDQGHPCGFCFVVYETHQSDSNEVEFISKTKLNDRIIRVDWDAGYKKGREKGRGTGGQQRRDDFRTKEDAERPRKKNNYQPRDRNERPERQERDRTRQHRDYDRQRQRDGERGRERDRTRQHRDYDRQRQRDGERGRERDAERGRERRRERQYAERAEREDRAPKEREPREPMKNEAEEY